MKESEILVLFKVVLHREHDGISVSVPAVPGCWSEGDSEAKSLSNIQDAIHHYLAAIDEQVRGTDLREVEVTV